MIKIKLINQKHEFGCPIACIAMILEKEYDDIIKDFNHDFDNEGLDTEKTIQYLADHGFGNILIKQARWNVFPKILINELIKPFAEVHIIKGVSKFDSQTGHILIMDSEGKFFDSSNGTIENLDIFYDIVECIGLWRTSKEEWGLDIKNG